jgi:hypothetical protein
MAGRMTLELDLSAVWQRTIEYGQIRSQFTDSNGRLLEVGIRISDNGPQHYAKDVSTTTDIHAGVFERPLDGSHLLIQWNQYRSLKPRLHVPRPGRQPDYSPDVNDCYFACQDPTNPLTLLRRNILLHATFQNYQWVALHNVLPIEKEGHFLWVPVRAEGALIVFPHWPQILTRLLLDDFLVVARSSTNAMTFFNSLHAGASVNHVHFHSVHVKEKMPIQNASTLAIGGHRLLHDYPASGLVFERTAVVDDIWPSIHRMQERQIPFNLICIGNAVYLIPRNIEHELVEEFPEGVIASMELSGKVITTDKEFYERADWESLQSAFKKTTLGIDAILALLA